MHTQLYIKIPTEFLWNLIKDKIYTEEKKKSHIAKMTLKRNKVRAEKG